MLDMIPMDCVYINSLNFLVGVVQQLLLLAWAVLGSPHVVGSGIDKFSALVSNFKHLF